MVVVSLYFGRDEQGGGFVSDAQWSAFAAGVIGRQFPDGFTVFDANGQWRDPSTGVVGREPTKVVQIAAADSPALAAAVKIVVAAYKTEFHQEAVGIVSNRACAAF
jgi:hypothetical protein